MARLSKNVASLILPISTGVSLKYFPVYDQNVSKTSESEI